MDPLTEVKTMSIGKPLSTTMNRLRRSARESCKWRGHDMTPFKANGNWRPYSAQTSVCRKCGMEVAVDAYPAPNGIDIGGEAVALNCE